MVLCNGYVHLHTRVGIATDSLNKPWTEAQINTKTSWQLLVRFSLTISCLGTSYLQEPNNANLTEGVPAILGAWSRCQKKRLKIELNVPFKKKIFGNIIAEIFNASRPTVVCFLDRLSIPGYHHSPAGLTVIADISVVGQAEIIEEFFHKRVEQITKQFRRGLNTDDERHNAVSWMVRLVRNFENVVDKSRSEEPNRYGWWTLSP